MPTRANESSRGVVPGSRASSSTVEADKYNVHLALVELTYRLLVQILKGRMLLILGGGVNLSRRTGRLPWLQGKVASGLPDGSTF